MIIKLDKVSIQTKKQIEAIDITPLVNEKVEASKVKEGVVNVVSLHNTMGIAVNEGLECLEEDIFYMLDKLFPEDEKYHHSHYLPSYGRLAVNAPCHLKNLFVGMSTFFPISEGKIVKSRLQTIYLFEFDGPVLRNFCVQILGE